MTTIKFNALMAEMTPEEIGEALWYVEVFERTGMSRQEADQWRRTDCRLAAVPGAEPALGHA